MISVFLYILQYITVYYPISCGTIKIEINGTRNLRAMDTYPGINYPSVRLKNTADCDFAFLEH